MSQPSELMTRLSARRVLAAAVIDEVEHAVPVARALLAGGLDVMEVTFRNSHATECIRRIRIEVPEMLIGAGTILTPGQIDEAMAVGATFGLSPGFNSEVVRGAVSRNFTFIPGVFTPGEIEQSLMLGCPVVKLFPAAAAGGPAFIRSIAAPYSHTDLQIIPLGGIGEHNLAEYLSAPLVIAVGGSWLTDRKLAAAGQWDEITTRTRRALAIASQTRS